MNTPCKDGIERVRRAMTSRRGGGGGVLSTTPIWSDLMLLFRLTLSISVPGLNFRVEDDPAAPSSDIWLIWGLSRRITVQTKLVPKGTCNSYVPVKAPAGCNDQIIQSITQLWSLRTLVRRIFGCRNLEDLWRAAMT